MGMFGRAGIAERLEAMETLLETLMSSQRESFDRLEERLASLERWQQRAESAERRLRELGEQATYLIEELSEARRWLRARREEGSA
jgi:hypothetical protein